MDDGDTPAKIAKRLTGAAGKPTNPSTQNLDDQIAIVTIQQKNETGVRMIGDRSSNQLVEIRPGAQEHDIDGRGTQWGESVMNREAGECDGTVAHLICVDFEIAARVAVDYSGDQ